MSEKPSYYLFTKWTKGEPVEKSSRGKPPPSEGEREQPLAASITEGWGGVDHGTGSMVGEHQDTTSGFTRQANKRDSFNEMLSNRDMHTQVGQNPFLAGESYLNHLKIQEDFLRPQNTAIMDPKANN